MSDDKQKFDPEEISPVANFYAIKELKGILETIQTISILQFCGMLGIIITLVIALIS